MTVSTRVRSSIKKGILLLVLLTSVTVLPMQNAHALDKRVALVFKTAAYGAGAGFLVGAGIWAMGIGGLDNYRNLWMGTAIGMYAGIGLGLYVVATPPEVKRQRATNPYQPRRPVGPDDWMNEDEEVEEYKRREPDSSVRLRSLPTVALRDPVLSLGNGLQVPSKPVFWMPLAQVAF